MLSTSPRQFAEHMRILHARRWRVVSLADAVQALEAGGADENLVTLTFDDGFQNFASEALPVLRHFNFPATLFAVTEYCGRSNDWPGQPASIRRQPLLGWSQIEQLAAHGITVASHTCTHRDLTTLGLIALDAELRDSQRILEEVLRQPIQWLAYPYGAQNAKVRRQAARYYRAACSTRLGLAGPRSNRNALERLDTYYLRSPAVFSQLFSDRLDTYLRARRALRELRRELAKRLHRGRAQQDEL